MRVQFTAPTKAFPFFHNVRVMVKGEWKKVVAYNQDLGGKSAALFATKEEMVAGVKRAIKC